MKRQEIVILTFSLSNNGAERVFSELANEWSAMGRDVTVVQFEKDAYGGGSFELNPAVKLQTLSRRNVGNKVKRYLLYLSDIRRYMKKRPEAVVVAFSFTTQIIVSVASLLMKNKLVFAERNDPNNCPYTPFQRKLRNLCFHRADRLVFQTENAQAYFPASVRKRSEVIVNPINPKLPEMASGERRKSVITAARLRPQKNLSLMIEAFARFHEDFQDYVLEIYGIGEQEERLKALADRLGVGKAVYFYGFVSDVNERMRDAAIYACSSDYEGISNSLLEAIGIGVPTVSTDCPVGGARQVIRDGENGLLVPVRDVEALAGAMKRLAGDRALAQRVSENGYKIRELYRVDRIAQHWLNVFDKD